MKGVHEYDYTIVHENTPLEYDSVTLNGHEFARIVRVQGWYQVQPTIGSGAGGTFSTRGTHHSAFEDCMFYASLEKLPEKFDLEVTE